MAEQVTGLALVYVVNANPPQSRRSMEPNSKELLYGFVQWLSESPFRVYQIGGAVKHGHIHLALVKFCEANKLPQLRDKFLDNINKPSHSF